MGIKDKFPQYVIAPCDLFLHFCIYKSARKKCVFVTTNHDERGRRAEQARNPAFQCFVRASHAPEVEKLFGVTSRRDREASRRLAWLVEFGVRNTCDRERT